jgi:uncharacterized protein YdeI (YjbR/CyaY-like superfamily)
MQPTFFASAADFRRWLKRHHAKRPELWVGFYKKDSGRGGLTYAEAVDEALCYGWIDGQVRRIDETSHMQRYTPRRPGSIWSKINVAKVRRLIAAGRMQPAGIAAFKARTAAKTGVYSFERKQPAALPPDFAKRFRANRKAWAFFNAQPPGYQRLLVHKIVSGKQAATRERWLARVVAASAANKRLNW